MSRQYLIFAAGAAMLIAGTTSLARANSQFLSVEQPNFVFIFIDDE